MYDNPSLSCVVPVTLIIRYAVYHTIVSKRMNVSRTDLGCNDLCHQSKLSRQTSSLSLKNTNRCYCGSDHDRLALRFRWNLRVASPVKWHEFNFNTIVATHASLLCFDPLRADDVCGSMIWISPPKHLIWCYYAWRSCSCLRFYSSML